MTIRSRPVLDRKHRPRWQDELRTQQLTVIGFAVAIAIALGIFGVGMGGTAISAFTTVKLATAYSASFPFDVVAVVLAAYGALALALLLFRIPLRRGFRSEVDGAAARWNATLGKGLPAPGALRTEFAEAMASKDPACEAPG